MLCIYKEVIMAVSATAIATNNGVVWDLTSLFPAFNGPEMQAFKQRLVDDVAQAAGRCRRA